MATSLREQMLEYLVGLLTATSGATFYRSREAAITRAENIVGVLRPEEEEEEYRGLVTFRKWTISLTVVARGDIPDQVADPVVAASHAALMGDTTLGGLCALLRGESTKWDFEIADRNAVAVEMRYLITYQTPVGSLTAET